MSLAQLISILQARKWIAIWVFLVTVIVATVISILLPNTYKATTSVVINSKGVDPVTGFAMPASLMPGYMGTQIDIITSKRVALDVVKKIGITNNQSAIDKFMEATEGRGGIESWYADLFLKNLEITPSLKSSVVEIGYSASDPSFAASIANAFAEAYIDTSLKLKTQPVKEAAGFFDNQMEELRANVEKAQLKLSAFQRENGITSQTGRLDLEMLRLQELSSQLIVAQADTYNAKSNREQLRRGDISQSPQILASPLIQSLKSNLIASESELADISLRLGENHPAYKAKLDEVRKLKASISSESQKASGGVGQSEKISRQRENEIRTAVAAQKERVLQLKSVQDEMAVLEREAESAQRIYESTLLKFGQTSIESKSGNTDITILTRALPPIDHSSPKRKLNVLISIFLGGFLGVVFAVFSELMDRKVRSAQDLSDLIDLPVIGDLSNQDQSISVFKKIFTRNKTFA